MEGYARNEALRMIREMGNDELQPDVFTLFGVHIIVEYLEVAWNSVITGCVQNGLFDERLNLFRQMVMAGVRPVEVSFSSIILACAHSKTLLLRRQLHDYISRLTSNRHCSKGMCTVEG
ncbi:hypothetical protein ACET3Z_002051 [Daucus carota]